MANLDIWRSTKFEQVGGRWRASRDRSEVSVGSRIMADLVARFYEKQIPIHATGRLLDLGCGKAPLAGIYRAAAVSVTTMDWAQSHGAEFVDIVHDINQPLPLQNESFNTVILSDVLEHLPDPQAVLKEINRILAPGGMLIANVPFLYWVHEAPYDFCRYTSYMLERFAKEAEFKIKAIEPLGGAPEVLFDLIGKMLMGRRIFNRLVPLLSTIHSMAEKSAAFRRYSKSSGLHFPLSYGFVWTKRC